MKDFIQDIANRHGMTPDDVLSEMERDFNRRSNN